MSYKNNPAAIALIKALDEWLDTPEVLEKDDEFRRDAETFVHMVAVDLLEVEENLDLPGDALDK